jgi:hypothetical protein
MNFSKKIVTISSIALLLAQPVAMAFELKLPTKSSDSGSAVDTGALSKQQDDLVKSLNASLRDLATSQKIMADALGLKDASALAETNANNLKKGDLTGKDDIQKAVANSEGANKLIQAELKKGTKLSEDSKALFSTSLVPYATGSVGIVVTGKKAAEALKSLTTTTDFTVLTKLSNLIYIGKEAPTLISTFTSTTGQLITFSKTNSIDTSGIEKAAKSLGE